MSVLFQVFLDLEGSHAARSCRSNRLTVAPVLHIAAGVNAGNLGKDVVVRLHVAVFIQIDLALEHLGIRNMTDAENIPLTFRIDSASVTVSRMRSPSLLSVRRQALLRSPCLAGTRSWDGQSHGPA